MNNESAIYEFKFDRLEKVIIKEISRVGIIDSITIDQNGIMYRVMYWDDATRNSVWVYAFEIEKHK